MSNTITKGQANIGRLNLAHPSSYSSKVLAAAGTGVIADAALISTENVQVTSADGTKAVKLPAAFKGELVHVVNTVSNQILPVLPNSSGTTINALGAGNAFNVPAGGFADFYAASSTQWYTSSATTVSGLTATGSDLNQLAGVQTVLIKKIALAAVDTAGGLFAWQAPARCFVVAVKVDVTTVASAACSADIGYTTVNATTLSDTIIDGADFHTATDVFDNVADAGTNGILGGTTNTGDQQLVAASGKWITGSTASGASAGLVGNAYIFYVLA